MRVFRFMESLPFALTKSIRVFTGWTIKSLLYYKINFNIILDEGEIVIKDLKTTFKDSVIINLNDTQLIIDNNKLKFAGYVSLDFIDVNNFYAHYQINRNYRKNIKKINFGFLLNLDDKFIEIDNLKINGNINQNLETFLNIFMSFLFAYGVNPPDKIIKSVIV